MGTLTPQSTKAVAGVFLLGQLCVDLCLTSDHRLVKHWLGKIALYSQSWIFTLQYLGTECASESVSSGNKKVALLRSGPLIGNMTAEVPGASGLVGGRGERNKYFRVLVKRLDLCSQVSFPLKLLSFLCILAYTDFFSSYKNGFTSSLTESTVSEYSRVVIVLQGERDGVHRELGLGLILLIRRVKCKSYRIPYNLWPSESPMSIKVRAR